MAAAAAAAAPAACTPDRALLLASFAAADQQPAADAPALFDQLQRGEYTAALVGALQAGWAAAGAPSGDSAPESTPDWFDAAGAAFRQLLTGPAASADAAQAVLAAAVAALHLFLQANLAGPDGLPLPECPFDLLDPLAAADWQQQQAQQQQEQQQAAGGSGSSSTAPAADTGASFGRDSASPGDRWAGAQLAESGEDPVGRLRLPQYLLLARVALLAPLDVTPAASGVAGAPAAVAPAPGAAAWLPAALPSWAWWAQRAVLLQQRQLSGLSASLRSLLSGLSELVLAAWAAPVEAALAGSSGSSSHGSSAAAPSSEAQLLAAGALLEAALLETAYGHVEAAKRLLDRSGAVLGFRSELTGALGVRTVHQQEAKAQLLVAVGRAAANPWTQAHAAGALPDVAEPQAQLEAATNEKLELPPDLRGFHPDSDVLPHPKLVGGEGEGEGSGGGAGSGAPAAATPVDLHSLEQALLLGRCLHVRKGSAADGLQPWEMAAYVDAIACQQRTQFLLHAAAALQACRLEKQRSRTRDRALLQMESLVSAMARPQPALPPPLRLRYAFAVWFPLAVQLRRELGELLVAMGLVGAALALFEGLELWDNLIVCYQLLDKRVQAEELIRRRLEATPDEPRLWCALGDLCLEDGHYLQAWERSGHRNARSQRSLARNALRREDYAKAAGHWEAALALNPLHAEGWFSLGYCYIKAKDYPAALRALTRSSQLEPDNGEAWNNLAAIHMHRGHWRQAYNALSEAVKHKRDSWQTWENYAQVAARVGQWQAAVRALGQVLALSSGQRLDLATLAALVGQVEAARSGAAPPADGQQPAEQQPAEQRGPQQSDAAVAAEGAAPAADPAATGGEAPSGLAELAAALGELSTSGGTGGGADPADAAAQAEAVAQAEARAAAVLEQAVGGLLKQVAATASGDSAFWEVYARYQAALGRPDAAKECLLKRVRALGGAGWQASRERFATYAGASEALCRAYLQAAAAGGAGAQRDLGSARMHLRGLIKQAQDRYEEELEFKQLQGLLAEVEAAQATLAAAAAGQ